MTIHLSEYLIPTTVNEALRLLKERGGRAAIVSGGTVQSLRLPSRVGILVDITRCGLESIEADAVEITIGATVTAATLAGSASLDGLGAGMLCEAAAAVSPQAVRNQVTVAGNITGHLSWADLPVALLALDATAIIARDPGTKRRLSLAELFVEHPRKVLEPGEIITAVAVRKPAPGTGGAFVKMARTAVDIGLANAAALLTVEAGVCKAAAIAFGTVQPRPARAPAAEALLVGAKLNETLIGEAAKRVAAGAVVHADLRASPEYRRELLATAVRRALISAWHRASGEEKLKVPRRMQPPPWPRLRTSPESGRVLHLEVDGAARRFATRPGDLLIDVLRREGVASVKRGCDEGYCGTCTVQVAGRVLNSCLVLAARVDGLSLLTAAGIGTVLCPHPLQTAMVEEGAVQCGFCTPGFVVAAKSLLDVIPDPSDAELRLALDGNLCRCTGYVKQLAAVQKAAASLRRRPRG
ncbi:MAG: FAD binding domain-containing protein [Deltaproteobacteria bacterium]|nr:FAD binding domain-containing protein [Deltaproteobacteria bacterium]